MILFGGVVCFGEFGVSIFTEYVLSTEKHMRTIYPHKMCVCVGNAIWDVAYNITICLL